MTLSDEICQRQKGPVGEKTIDDEKDSENGTGTALGRTALEVNGGEGRDGGRAEMSLWVRLRRGANQAQETAPGEGRCERAAGGTKRAEGNVTAKRVRVVQEDMSKGFPKRLTDRFGTTQAVKNMKTPQPNGTPDILDG